MCRQLPHVTGRDHLVSGGLPFDRELRSHDVSLLNEHLNPWGHRVAQSGGPGWETARLIKVRQRSAMSKNRDKRTETIYERTQRHQERMGTRLHF